MRRAIYSVHYSAGECPPIRRPKASSSAGLVESTKLTKLGRQQPVSRQLRRYVERSTASSGLRRFTGLTPAHGLG